MAYRQYFDIDPEYFPQVDKKIIDTQPDLWKKFYPHPSFVNLLKATVDVLARKQKLSMWVDGAYGTGKSHAVLTLKKLIEASDEDTLEYFEKYKLDNFLCKNLTAQKNGGKILVCHRYGSSDISNDMDLIVAIQEGIEKALGDAGIVNAANTSLRNSLIRYFSNPENKASFDIFAKGSYKDTLGGDTADDILYKLNNYDDDALRSLIAKIFKVQSVKGSFSMNTGELCEWIREVIEKNGLKEIIFMWDEFSEYFENNMHHLTGFQQIAELAATAPFCLMIVTHKAEAYFSDSDSDKRKILDRFVPPIHISLPENIAFELMAQAMKVTDDPDVAGKWIKIKNSLNTRTASSRNAVIKKIQLTDKDLTNVLPIHPYAALILQHISIYYTSTARSMFNFIKNDEGEDVKAFQWFIDNYDSKSQNPFITVDMLWSFFYESGRDKLANGIKEVLCSYTAKLEKQLVEDEKRVLKTILLLQAISDRMSGNRDIFLPNAKNLELAFEGTYLAMSAKNIAEKLLKDHVITRTPLTGDVYSYCCMNSGSIIDITPFIPTARAKSTKDMSFMNGTDLRNIIDLTGSNRLRYQLVYATVTDFDSELKKAANPSAAGNKMSVVAVIARDDQEAAVIHKKIESFVASNNSKTAVILDFTSTLLGKNEYEEFVENYATSLAIGQSDINERKTYESYATDVLKDWAKRIKAGKVYVYGPGFALGETVPKASELDGTLRAIAKAVYPKCLEGEYTSVLNTMYDSTSLNAGALCGITEETKGTFKSGNEATKLENALKDGWKKPEYWKKSHSYIAELKKAVDEIIENFFAKTDRIAISTIYSELKAEPYGFMPCNLTAFVLGFVLKEYAKGAYSYSDGLTTVPLDPDHLAGMIAEIIKQDNTADKHYKEKYIVTLTEEERAFNKATSEAFEIPEMYCVSITDTRSRIREKMKNFTFPIWLTEYALEGVKYKTSEKIVVSLIENYCGIANNKNMAGDKSDNDIALTIGRICIDNPGAAADLKQVLNKEKCRAGMETYLKSYADGKLLALAGDINDGGQYINALAYKFSSDAANWVWNRDTVNSKIDEVITEYEIVDLSNHVLTKHNSYGDTIRAWNDKLGQIRVAYSVIKNEIGESKTLIEMLCTLKKTGSLLDSQKKAFCDALRAYSGDFKVFFENQTTYLKKACSAYFDGNDLSDSDIATILEDDKYGFKGAFTLEATSYTNKLGPAIKAYVATLDYVRLRKHWKQLTGTESPFDWSNTYNMPVLILVPDHEIGLARSAFSTINSKSADAAKIAAAEDYLSKMSYASVLGSKSARDKAFRDEFLSENSVLFDDVDSVTSYLRSHVSDAPFYWQGNKDVKAKIAALAKSKYTAGGYSKAKKIIDDMPAEQVKAYLKQLIEDNVSVGVEIIKSKK